MKKLLIIQTDPAYFLLETLTVLELYAEAFSGFDYDVLVNEQAYKRISRRKFNTVKNVIFVTDEILQNQYDLSINLSLNEEAWDLQAQVSAKHRSGASRLKGEVKVPDIWSNFLLTLKADSPFITFHLQDLYKNIFSIKKILLKPILPPSSIKTIVFGLTAQKLFHPSEQEAFLNGLTRKFRILRIKDIAEVLPEERDHVLYIGPATLDALLLQANQNIFLSSNFQGFNLLANNDQTYLITTPQQEIKAQELLVLVEKIYHQQDLPASPYHVYRVASNNIGSPYLESLNGGDDQYPLYQAYTVLWNFLINLSEVDLPMSKLSPGQLQLVDAQLTILEKLIRLHDYALVSLDTVLRESKSSKANSDVIEGHLKNLREIDATFESISQGHALLRPLLDYYRIRRGQNDGVSLLEQVQSSILAYHEEHQALKAFSELLIILKNKS